MRYDRARVEKALGGPTFALWLYLVGECNSEGWCNVTRDRMASEARLTPKQVRRGLSKLKKVYMANDAWSRRDPHRRIWGGVMADGTTLDLLALTDDALASLGTWGGKRAGAGRPRTKKDPKNANQRGQTGQQETCIHCGKSQSEPPAQGSNQEGHETDQETCNHSTNNGPPRIPKTESSGTDNHIDLHENDVTPGNDSTKTDHVAHLNTTLGGEVAQPQTCGPQTPIQEGPTEDQPKATVEDSTANEVPGGHNPLKTGNNSRGTVQIPDFFQEGPSYSDQSINLETIDVRSSLRSDLIARRTRDQLLTFKKQDKIDPDPTSKIKEPDSTSKINESARPPRKAAPPKQARSTPRMPLFTRVGSDRELAPPLFALDRPTEELAPPLLSESEQPLRTTADLLSLPICPKMRVPGPRGGKLQLAVELPYPRDAKTATPLHEILSYTSTLFSDLTAAIFGEADYRVRGIANAKSRTKNAMNIQHWWLACAEKEVKPAEWLHWALQQWQRNHPGKKVVLGGVFSAQRVRDGATRHFFREEHKILGGNLEFDEGGRLFLRKHAKMSRDVRMLCLRTEGRATDDQVREVVAKTFPKGVENAEKILLEIHQKLTAETLRLKDEANRGRFVWPL